MEDLSLVLLDITQNSIRANASSLFLSMFHDTKQRTLLLKVRDDGAGMDPQTLEAASDPFFTTRTTRDVGLGLSHLRQIAEATNGSMRLESSLRKGTSVLARFDTSHPDMLPLGNLSQTLLCLLTARSGYHLDVVLARDERRFHFSTHDVESVLQAPLDLAQPELERWTRKVIEEGVEDVFGAPYVFQPDLERF